MMSRLFLVSVLSVCWLPFVSWASGPFETQCPASITIESKINNAAHGWESFNKPEGYSITVRPWWTYNFSARKPDIHGFNGFIREKEIKETVKKMDGATTVVAEFSREYNELWLICGYRETEEILIKRLPRGNYRRCTIELSDGKNPTVFYCE